MKLFDIHSFLEGLLNEGFTINITNVTDNLDGTFTLDIDGDTLYLRVGKTWSISGNDYRITSITTTQIVLSGLVVPPVGVIQMYPAYYNHGTIMQTSGERANLPSTKDKTPVVYLLEPYKERYPNDYETTILAEMNLRLFFLDESQLEDKTTDQYYDEVISKMRSLCEAYLTRLENSSTVNELEDIDIINHTRFAKFVSGQGYESNLFTDHLSGVEASFSLKIEKKCAC